jgi:hypothetical protein
MNDIAMSVDPRLGPGGNFPPEPIESAHDPHAAAIQAVAKLESAAIKWGAKKAIETAEAASDIAAFLSQLEAHWAEIESQRKKEKKPFDDGARAVQEKYKPLLDRILLLKGAITPLHTAWLKLKDRRIEQQRLAAEREAAEAQRRADQLAEQANGTGPGAVVNTIAAAEAAKEADAARRTAAAIPRRAQTRDSLGGRTRSLRTVWLAAVIEPDLCYRHFRDHPDVKDLLHRLANAAARAGVRHPDLPGCYIFSEEQ